MTSEQRYLLFDAAIIPLQLIRSVVDAGVPARCLYDDLGSQAERISPWLLQDKDEARGLASRMREDRRYAHGVSRLGACVEMSELHQHLQHLRYVRANERRYFLRYADGRAWLDLWAELQPMQQLTALGPVSEWEAFDCEPIIISKSGVRHQEGDCHRVLPVGLSKQQWAGVIRRQRITQRWMRWESEQKSLSGKYAPCRLRELAGQTGEWLQAHRIVDGPEVHDIEMAVLRTDGAALADSLFDREVTSGNDRRRLDTRELPGVTGSGT